MKPVRGVESKIFSAILKKNNQYFIYCTFLGHPYSDGGSICLLCPLFQKGRVGGGIRAYFLKYGGEGKGLSGPATIYAAFLAYADELPPVL